MSHARSTDGDLIQFVETEELWRTVTIKDAFEFRKDRPAHWLQRACLWVLRKLGAHHMRDTVTIRRHRLDARTFIERLFKQKAEIAKLLNREPQRLLIGSEDYFEMMNEPAIHQSFSFRAEYGKDREILGLEVQIIPWMRGVLVMP